MLKGVKLFDMGEDVRLLYHGDSMGLFPLDTQKDKEFENWVQTCIDELPTTPIANSEELSSSKLKTLILPVASSCNLRCPYCFAQTNAGDFQFSDYTEEDIDRLLVLLGEYNGQEQTTLIFFGGEPLIKFELIKYTINLIKEKYGDRQFGYSITTNGTLLNEERAKFLKENNFALLLSMDGYDNDYNYRRFKNGKSSVARVLKNIQILKDANIPFQIRATITSDNPYLYETFLFFEELKVPFTIAFAYSSENTSNVELNTFNEQNITMINKVFHKLTEYYISQFKKGKPVYDTLFASLRDILEHRVHRGRVCAAGTTHFTVMANGDIYTCAHLMNNPGYVVGNLSDFKSVRQDNSSTPRDIGQIKACGGCWAKHLCVGGCTSQKLSMGVGADDAFPKRQCNLELALFEYYIRLYYIYKTLLQDNR